MAVSSDSSSSGKGTRPPRLTSLRARPTDDKDVAAFCDDLAGESDKGAAILASADLDSDLESKLIKFIEIEVELDIDERNLLFGESGPLASLGAKARLWHAMGLYGKVTRDDIIIISRIRNAFAHTPKSLSFDDQLISENCHHLKVLRAYKDAGIFTIEDLEAYSPRMLFTFTALLIPLAIGVYHVQRVEQEIARSNVLLAYSRLCKQSDALIQSTEIADWVHTNEPKRPP